MRHLQSQTEPVYYRYYGGYYGGWNPGLAIAGTAAGLLTLGAVGRRRLGYMAGTTGHPITGIMRIMAGLIMAITMAGHIIAITDITGIAIRHYGYYGGGIHTGRSVGHGHMHHGAHYR